MLYLLGAISVILTYTMFHTRQMMLGFPCVIFWAITGGRAYTLSTATWDIYYFVFIACTVGMTIFSALSMFALRTRKQEREEREELVDEVKESEAEGQEPFIDEVGQGQSRKSSAVQARAKKRREKGIKKRRLDLFTH